MKLNKTYSAVCCLIFETVDGVSECCQIAHQSLVFFQQRFRRIFVFSVIGVVDDWFFFFHPGFGFVSVRVVLVGLEGVFQVLFALNVQGKNYYYIFIYKNLN